jgi:hypothetical protein
VASAVYERFGFRSAWRRNPYEKRKQMGFSGPHSSIWLSAKLKAAIQLQGLRAMLDVAMMILVVICFALAKAYASLCDRLLAPPGAEPDKDVSS